MPRPERLPVAAHLGDQRARLPVRGADPHRGDAPARRGRHRRALEIQGRPRRRRARRAVLPVAAPAARVAAGGPRSAGVPVEPEDRSLPGGGLHLHAARHGQGAAEGRDARSTSPTRFTPTSATSASARASTGAWCRCAPASRTATSSRSSRNAAHKPSRDWLNFAVTSRARNKIKHLIQVEEKERAVELGRRVFEKEARRFGLNGTKLLEGDIAKVLAEFAAPKPEDLLAQIGYGKVSPRLRARQDRPAGPAEGAGAGASGRLGGQARAAHRRRARSHQGARRRRCDGVPGEVLQPDSRREDRRLHHARQGRLRALREVRERDQPDVRPGAPHRRRVGQGQRHCALHRAADDRGRGSQGHARGAQRSASPTSTPTSPTSRRAPAISAGAST